MDDIDPENSFDTDEDYADHGLEDDMPVDQRSPWLRPTRLIAGLVALMLIVLVISRWLGEPESDERSAQTSSQPAPVATVPEMASGVAATEIFQSLSGVNVRTDNVRRQLERLRKSVERTVRSPGTAGNVEQLFASDFQAIAIDRERFASRLDDSLVSVSRWSHAKSAPVFSSGTDAVTEFSESAYEPWIGREPFRLDLKIYTIDEQDASTRTTIVASAFGKSADDSSRQATSLWETVWTRPESPKEMPLLQSVKVVAQEELATAFKTDQLLADCTVSVLKRCKCLPEQLDYGVDQWARRIPGIDLMGEHGLAVGDVNGDGIDDIYVCQPHGLPNLLLIQNPDGTCDEIGKKWQVDALDSSYAALMVDLDNDRDQDLVVSTDETLLVFSNTGKGAFQIEHRLPVGRSARSICAADFDRDGDLDIFLCKYEGVRKRDDMIVLPVELGYANDGGRNVLLRNDESFQFTDATEEAGITAKNSYFTRSAVWSDYDQDGDQDLYVVNEFATDQIFENQNGWFREMTDGVGINEVARHRTVSCGDFNHDGRSDFYVATDVPFSVQRSFGKVNRGSEPRDFRDTVTGDSHIWYAQEDSDQWRPFSMRAPLFSSHSAFGSVATDLNNDGLDDIIVTNGTLTRFSTDQVDDMLYRRLFNEFADGGELDDQSDVASVSPSPGHVARVIRETTDMCRAGYSFAGMQRNQCFLSIGQLGFANFSAASGIDFLQDGRGVATTDWDHDGDSDVILTSRNGCRLKILCNQLDSGNDFLQLTMVGTKSNSDAIGTRALVFLKDKPHPIIKTVNAGSGYLSQSSKSLTFGLGQNAEIEKLTIVWPDGSKQNFTDVRPNRRYRMVEGRDTAAELPSDRLDVQLAATTHPGREQLPPAEKSLFNPPALVPELTMIQTDGKTYPVLGIKPKDATLVVVVDESSQAKNLLQKISDAADSWDDKNAECIAVVTDSLEAGEPSSRSAGKSMMDEVGFPFRWGLATEDTKTRVSLWCGNFFGSQQMPRTPFGILFNKDREAVVFYDFDQINDSDLLEDVAIAGLDAERIWDKIMPTQGRWFAPYRFSVADRMTLRLAELGQQDAAKELHEASSPFRAYELATKGFELLSIESYELAKKFFREALRLDPESPMARVGIAKVLRREATQVIGQGAESANQRNELQEKATIHLDYALELEPTNVEAIVARSNLAIDAGQIGQAIKLLKRFVKLQPDRYEIHAIIGRLLFQGKQTSEAAQWLVEAFEKRPTLPFVAGDLGFLYLTVGEHPRAVQFLELANRLQPSDQNVRRLLAEAYYLTGNYEDCVQRCEEVIQKEPNRKRLSKILAWMLATAPYETLRDPDRALEIVEPDMRIFEETSVVYNEIYAAIMAEKGDFDQAREYQNKAIDLVRTNEAVESYTDAQKKGLRTRLQLYERSKPYRMEKPAETPLGAPGLKEEK
jgi:tetratricopeptide (TPR) repeat protein